MAKSEYRATKYKIIMGLKVILSQEKKKERRTVYVYIGFFLLMSKERPSMQASTLHGPTIIRQNSLHR